MRKIPLMIDPLEFKVSMVPIPKGRPRFGNGRTYTPQETVMFESAFKALSRKYKPLEPLKCPIALTLEFHFQRPKTSKRQFHTVKPDNDNLIKSVTDSMNEIFWIDDAQVVRVIATKFYSEQPFIRVLIQEFTEEKL